MSLDAYWERPACTCGECRQAGVSDQPQKRDPRTHAWLHGYALKSLYEARDDFWRRVHAKGEERKRVKS